MVRLWDQNRNRHVGVKNRHNHFESSLAVCSEHTRARRPSRLLSWCADGPARVRREGDENAPVRVRRDGDENAPERVRRDGDENVPEHVH